MGTAKILIDGVGIDLTQDTVEANKMLSGTKAHNSNGNSVTGSIPTYTGTQTSGTKSITANGTYDVTEFASAAVNVASGADVGIFTAASAISGGTAIKDAIMSVIDSSHEYFFCLAEGQEAKLRSSYQFYGGLFGINEIAHLKGSSVSISPATGTFSSANVYILAGQKFYFWRIY